METLTIKKGDTLLIDGQRVDDQNEGVSLANTTVSCEMRKGRTRVTLGCTVLDEATGQFLMQLTAAETDALVPGTYIADIQYADVGGLVTSSNIFKIHISGDVTSGPN